MVSYEVGKFVEYRTGTWNVVEVIEANAESIVVQYGESQVSLQTNDTKLAKFRQNTERLQGSQKLFISHNFLDYENLNQKVCYFFSNFYENSPSVIMNFLTGEAYFSLYQMMLLDYSSEYSSLQEPLKNIIRSLLKLFVEIIKNSEISFVERNKNGPRSTMEAYGMCWYEMTDMMKFMFPVVGDRSEYVSIQSNFLENPNEKAAFVQELKKLAMENSKGFREIYEVLNRQNCLRFVYSLDMLWQIRNFADFRGKTQKILSFVKRLEKKEFVWYSNSAMMRILEGNEVSENEYCELLEICVIALEFTAALLQKIEIIKEMSNILEQHWSPPMENILASSKLQILLVQHEETVKRAAPVFEKIIYYKKLDSNRLNEIFSSIKDADIMKETFKLFATLGKILPFELTQQILNQILDKYDPIYENSLISFSQVALSESPSEIFNFQTLFQKKIRSDSSRIMAAILIYNKLHLSLMNFIKNINPEEFVLDTLCEILKNLKSSPPYLAYINNWYSLLLTLLSYFKEGSEYVQGKILEIFEIYLESDGFKLDPYIAKYCMDNLDLSIQERICKWIRNKWMDNCDDIVFYEFLMKLSGTKGFADAFLHSFLRANEKFIEVEGGYVKFCTEDTRAMSEILEVFDTENLGDLENQFIETITGVFFRTPEMSRNAWQIFENAMNKPGLSQKKIKLIKAVHGIEYESQEEIDIFCKYGDKNWNIEISKFLPFRFVLQRLSNQIKKEISEFDCYFNSEIVKHSINIENLQGKELEIVINNRMNHMNLQNIENIYRPFLNVLVKMISTDDSMEIFEILKEKYIGRYFMAASIVECEEKLKSSNSKKFDLYYLYEIEAHLRNHKNQYNPQILMSLFYSTGIHSRSIQILLHISNSQPIFLNQILNHNPVQNLKAVGSLINAPAEQLDKSFPLTLILEKILETGSDISNIISYLFNALTINPLNPAIDIHSILITLIKKNRITRRDLLNYFKDMILNILTSRNFGLIYSVLEKIDFEVKVSDFIWRKIREKEEKSFADTDLAVANGLKLIALFKSFPEGNEEILIQKLLKIPAYFDDSLCKYKSVKVRKQMYSVLFGLEDFKSPSNIFNKILEAHNQYLGFQKSYPKYLLSLSKRVLNSAHRGFKNFGSTCYINSTMQLLFSVSSFREKILSIREPNTVSTYLGYLFAKLQFSVLNSIKSHCFFKNFLDYDDNPINPTMQMDADEFLRSLFFKLTEENSEKIEEEFIGKLQRDTICKNCNGSSTSSEEFFTLSLEVKQMKSIEESIENFSKCEKLVGENQYFCERCQSKQDGEKIVRIAKIPQSLFICLKRFEYSVEEGQFKVLNDECAFGKELGIGGKKFQLRGVILHVGNVEGGHYIAFVKHEDYWVCFNDEVITMIPEESIQFNNMQKHLPTIHNLSQNTHYNPYILLYQIASEVRNYHFPYANSKLSKKIIEKNQNSLLAKFFLAPDFYKFIHLLIKNKKYAWNLCKILFTSFINMEEKAKDIVNVIKSTVEAMDDFEFAQEFFKSMIDNSDDVLKTLVEVNSDEVRELFVFMVKRMIEKNEGVLVNELIRRLVAIFYLNYYSYNVTAVIEILVFFIQKMLKDPEFRSLISEYICTILRYIVQTAFPYPEGTMIPQDLRQTSFIPTDFTCFFSFLVINQNLITEDVMKLFYENYEPVLNCIRTIQSVEVFANFTYIIYKNMENILPLSESILAMKSTMKIPVLLKYYGNFKDMNAEEIVFGCITKILNIIEFREYKKVIIFTSNFFQNQNKTPLLNYIGELIKAKLEEHKNIPIELMKGITKDFQELHELCKMADLGNNIEEPKYVKYQIHEGLAYEYNFQIGEVKAELNSIFAVKLKDSGSKLIRIDY